MTGRRLPAARRVAGDLDGALPLVLHNGALIVLGGEVVSCTPLGRAVARRAIRIGRGHDAHALLHQGRGGEGRLVVEEAALRSPMLAAYSLDPSNPDLVTIPDVEAACDADDPIQVMFGGPLEEMAVLERALTTGLGGDAHVVPTVYPEDGVALLDILHPAVDKATALAFLQRRYDVAPAETLAIGDNWNDRRMLESAGLGLVMGNAPPGMLAIGLASLPTNDEDGVAVAVERYVLGCSSE